MANIDYQTFQVLPFYYDLAKQNFKKKWLYDDLCSVPLITPRNRLLPFQLKRLSTPNTIQYIYLYCFNGDFVEDVYPNMPANELRIYTVGSYDYITYYATKDLASFLDEGIYYLDVYDGITHFYSEIFSVKCFEFGVNKKFVVVPKNIIGWSSGGNNYQIVLNNPTS